MELILIKYGYFLLFLGVAVEGETFLLAGAFLAHRGYFSLWLVLLVAVLANSAADGAYYLLARARGREWLDQRFSSNRHYRRALALADRHANWLLLFSRYAFGFRIIIPAACGMVRMPPLRYAILALLAGIIWAVPTAVLGFYLGDSLAIFLHQAYRYEMSIVLALVAAGIALLLYRHAHRSGWIENISLEDLHALAPWMIGFMGVLNLVSAVWPRSHETLRMLENWLPFEVTQPSRSLMLLAGVALIQVTRGLARGKKAAWYVAMVSLATSLLLHITRGLDLHHSLIAALLLTYLVYYRRRFHALSDPVSVRLGLISIPFLLSAIFLYGYIGLRHMEDRYRWLPDTTPGNEAFRVGILIVEPQIEPATVHAAEFLNSIQIGGWLARFYIVILLLRPVILRRRSDAADGRLGQHGLPADSIPLPAERTGISGSGPGRRSSGQHRKAARRA